ncbi:NAD(P)/FAD-dependent oxidoreductase [Prosthecomicrobium pneumaticum]|uniref:Glycine/D-amino acid oxidase-like deaminating enzyme n=1 Tax=Prosthecomicrobium pneumaticum TaxID=81895 RepID=A0A7W9FN60_9HYPH|nr:FAD-binding oxidoreductase [Prosthecomicrobium pneumaticum]MBB5753720.1 glycine/D-amino acid oxidase-like deaminating enzyme [Prosthecomicrobium pneumaticum]
MAVETFHRTLWSALAPAAPPTPPLDGMARADVVIVGAGLLGLSAALHLAETGVDVAVLEAAEPGFGASGRNTGFVVPSLRTSLGPGDVTARLGAHGEPLTRLVGQSGTIVFGLIRRLGIACAAEQTGWMQPAHSAAMMRTLETRQRDWAARGRTVTILDAAETARRAGIAFYHGALVDPTGGQINPLAYARGLAAAAIGAGARIHAASRVAALDRADGGWLVRTARGAVRADRVLLTTNALVDALEPSMAASIIPVRVHQIATEPLAEAFADRLLVGRSPLADTRRHTFALRWSPDGRLVTGGMVMPGPGALGRAERGFLARLRRFVPGLGPVRADFVWNGVIAATLDQMPRFVDLAPGLDAAIGCNGRGVALTTALGREIAGLYAGRIAAADFPLPHGRPEKVPGHFMARHGPALWLPWSNWRDDRESAAGR